MQTSEVLELLTHRHPRVQTPLFGHVSEPQPLGEADRTPVPEHVATIRLDETEDVRISGWFENPAREGRVLGPEGPQASVGFVGLAPRKTAAARSMKPTPARISATPTTMLKIATPVAM